MAQISIGQQFGRLTIIENLPHEVFKRARCLCACSCGKTKVIIRKEITRPGKGAVRSCGCLKSKPKSHGHAIGTGFSAEYRTWRSMLLRCRSTRFKYYGGRGIKVCERWLRFENFLADMGPRYAGMTLDRIDNEGGYEPRNCRWATIKEQANNKRSSRRITANGETRTLAQWSELTGILDSTIAKRIERGISAEDAVSHLIRK